MIYPAHIHILKNGEKQVQTVEAHCRNSAKYARDAVPAGLKETVYLAGLIHDMGKYTDAFRTYITKAAEGQPVKRGSVNHTFAGVHFIWERYHRDEKQSLRNIASEVIAFAIGAHHGQFDCIDPEGKDGFLHRVHSEKGSFAEAKENFLIHCADLKEIDLRFAAAEKEITKALACLKSLSNGGEELFLLALLVRLISAAVIEGDRRDTAEFMQGIKTEAEEKEEAAWFEDKLISMEKQIDNFPRNSSINNARGYISDCCQQSAERGSGIYRLTVPTGGGKTLSALRYGLAAAAKGKKRIFFITPLLSILDQNAAVIQHYIQDKEMILEHHSNVVREKENIEQLDENELLVQNWQAPIVITTLVQFFNTLFDGKTSAIRRMAALSESVIIIDEVQSVPRHMLTQFNLALNFLSGFCQASIVLCSATQPAFEKAHHRIRYAENAELVPENRELWQAFKRTEMIDRRKKEGYTIEELACFSKECAEKENSLLVICNTKAEARKLFLALRSSDQRNLFHLSTAMCMEHRMKELNTIRQTLLAGQSLICVSTQLVEAGVDFSFGCVIRISAGMENLVQAAGRCNRNGEYGRLCPVYIMNIQNESLSKLKEIREAQQAAESLLLLFSRNPERFSHDLTDSEALKTYYTILYGEMKQNAQDYPLSKYAAGATLFDFLSYNRQARIHCQTGRCYTVGQAFRTAGDAFCVFENVTTDVVVPYEKGQELIANLCSDQAKYDIAYRAELIKKADRYAVSLYDYELEKLREKGGIHSLYEGAILVLDPSYYSDKVGFLSDGTIETFMEV